MPKRIPASQLLRIKAQRICVIKPSALGDIVQSLPLLPVLRERFPGAKISWVVASELAELLEDHPDLDEIIRFNRFGSLSSLRRLLVELRRHEFDLVFDLQGLLRTAVMNVATGAPLRVGLQTAREGARSVCHLVIPDTGRLVPAHLRYWRIAEAIGMGEQSRDARLAVGKKNRAWAERRLQALPRPVLAVHLGGRWRTKRWPVEKFAVVAAKATRLYGFSTVLVGANSELLAGAQFEHLLRRFIPSAQMLNLVGRTALKQLAAVLEACDVLLTNDSGPMHVSAALGTPVLGLFTCTSPLLSGPPGGEHELVATRLSCAASYKKRCPYSGRKHMACFEELSTDRVWQGFVRLMRRSHQGVRAA